MLLLKSQGSKDSPLLSPNSPKALAELAFWGQLQFSFDMDNEPQREPQDNSGSRRARRTRSSSVPVDQSGSSHNVYPFQSDPQDAALLAQFAAAAGMSSHDLSSTSPYGPHMSQGAQLHSGPSTFPGHLYNQGDMSPTQLPPLSSLVFPWNPFPPPQPSSHQFHQDHFESLQRSMSLSQGISPYPYTHPALSPPMSTPPESTNTGRPSRRASTSNVVASSSTAASSPDLDQTEAERISISEEKRRRNTAASARFRIKKKQRTTNLERTVSDLAGRAEDLEREAADLRRENGWLKEIVMLKGSRLAGVNLASHILAENARQSASGSQPTASGSGSTPVSGTKGTNLDSDDDSSEEEDAKASKSKKGKARKK